MPENPSSPSPEEASTSTQPPRPSALLIWIAALRPKTLGAAIAPVMIGSAMAFSEGLGHLPTALAALIAALLIQIGTNFANDYFDFVKGTDTEERLGPRRATASGWVTPETMKQAYQWTFGAAMLVGVYLVYQGGFPILLIGLLSIAAGIAYTGGPFPLAYNGLGDVFVLIFFGPVAVGGSYYVQTQEMSVSLLLAGLGPGLIATALLAVNNLRDADTDAQTNKRTLAVLFGKDFARFEYVLCISFAFMMPLLLVMESGRYWLSLLALLALLPARAPLSQIILRREGVALNETLALTGKLLLIYSLLFSVGLLLS
jgi:1,4-dihydroxy-2-naphthoate octaprenyltransferase